MKKLTNAQKLRKTRLFLNLTQRELSVRLGVSASSISRYENERTAVSPRVQKWVNRKYRQFHLSHKVIKSSKDHSVCSFMPKRCYFIISRSPSTTSFSIWGRRVFITASRRYTEAGAELTPTASSLISVLWKFRTLLWRADFKGVIYERQPRT